MVIFCTTIPQLGHLEKNPCHPAKCCHEEYDVRNLNQCSMSGCKPQFGHRIVLSTISFLIDSHETFALIEPSQISLKINLNKKTINKKPQLTIKVIILQLRLILFKAGAISNNDI